MGDLGAVVVDFHPFDDLHSCVGDFAFTVPAVVLDI